MKILLAGGGTLGHVVPLEAVQEELSARQKELSFVYVGQKGGREELYLKDKGERFLGISCGKIRRYFDWQNFIDPFRIVIGLFQSICILLREKPDVIFAKGGFVSLPVALAAYLLRKPLLVHESDAHLGLANKIAGRFADVLCLSFDSMESLPQWAQKKAVVTGNPIRPSLFAATVAKGKEVFAFSDNKPVLFVTGGSSGAKALNDFVYDNLDALLSFSNVYLQVGKGNLRGVAKEGFAEVEFVSDMGSAMKASALCVMRGGAGALFEMMALEIPSVIVPYPYAAANHQYKNAKLLSDKGICEMFEESVLNEAAISRLKEMMTDESLLESLRFQCRGAVITDGAKRIADELFVLHKE